MIEEEIIKMKKLNEKGFTLIELLAVIVILAIVAAITIPTVLSSMGNARQSTFNTSAQTVADWFEKEYSAAQINMADAEFTALCGADGSTCVSDAGTSFNSEVGKKALETAGVKASNYDRESSTVKINTNGRVCITLKASNSGDFSSVKTTTATSATCS